MIKIAIYKKNWKAAIYIKLNIEHKATNNGFKFSKSKTQCVYFCQSRKQTYDPVPTLYGTYIPVILEYKYLD